MGGLQPQLWPGRWRPKELPEFKKLVADHFWLCTKADSSRSYYEGRKDALMGDANRSLYGPWTYDVGDIKCPVFLYQGEGDTADGATIDGAKWVGAAFLTPYTRRYQVLVT